MHLYLLTRGIKKRVDEWENDLGAQWMPLKYKMPDGKIVDGRIKLQIRVVRLHEVVFPKEYEKQVMSLIEPGDASSYGKWASFINKIIYAFALKKPMKDWKPSDQIDKDGIATVALGTREDAMNFNINHSVQELGITPEENL